MGLGRQRGRVAGGIMGCRGEASALEAAVEEAEPQGCWTC